MISSNWNLFRVFPHQSIPHTEISQQGRSIFRWATDYHDWIRSWKVYLNFPSTPFKRGTPFVSNSILRFLFKPPFVFQSQNFLALKEGGEL